MAVQPLDLPSTSNPGRYGADGAVRLLNCYPESRGKEGKIALPLYAVDGLIEFATLSGGGRCRGMLVVGADLWVISGRLLLRVDSGGGATIIGGIPGDGPCYIAQNQKAPTPQIMIVTDGLRFIIEDGVLGTISDTDLIPPNSVVFLNQRFVVTSQSGRFQWSDLTEGSAYDPLNFANAEYGPDGLVRAFVRRGELLLIGPKTIEPWYAPESGEDAFARAGTVVERGCVNGATVAMVEETVVFVADDLTVRSLEGYQAKRISNHAVERSIRDTANRGNMVAWAYSKDGHSFYVLQGDEFTWIFDATTSEWHERVSFGHERWQAQFYAEFASFHVVGDHAQAKLYRLSEDAYYESHDGNEYPLIMSVAIPINAYPNKVELNSFFLDTIPGVGLNSSDEHDANPKAMIKVSKNGGKTFGSERQRPIGRIGKYSAQVKCNSFGTSNEDGFVVECSVSAAVAKAFSGCAGDMNVIPR